MNYLASLPANQLANFVLYLVILVVVWLVLRLILRIAHRIFVFGCGAILVLGLFLILIRFLRPG